MAEERPSAKFWYNDPDVPEIVRQLLNVRTKGLVRLRALKLDEEFSPLLEQAYLRGFAGDGKWTSIRRLLRTAIAAITDENFRQAALWELQVDKGIGLSLKYRREHIYKEIFHVSEKTYRRDARYERRLVYWIADEIEKIELPTQSTASTRAYGSSASLQPSVTSLPVTPISRDEAVNVARNLNPNAPQEDCFRLAVSFGCSPRLIQQATEYLRHEQWLSIQELCKSLARNPLPVMDAMCQGEQYSYSNYYRNTVDQLSEIPTKALDVLVLLAFTYHKYVPVEYVMAYLCDVPLLQSHDIAHGIIEFNAAVRPLVTRDLITVSNHEIQMHPVAHGIIRALLTDKLPDVARRANLQLGIGMKDFLSSGWSPFVWTGHDLAYMIVDMRYADHFRDSDILLNGGRLAGPEWELLVDNLWAKYFAERLQPFLYAKAMAPKHDGHILHISVEALEEDTQNLHPFQQEERQRLILMFKSAWSERQSSGVPLAEKYSADAIITGHNSIYSMTRNPIIETPLGELNLSSMLPDWSTRMAHDPEADRAKLTRILGAVDGDDSI